MPDTAFALWQSRTGLVRAVDAAHNLGVGRRSIELLRKGDRKPSGPMRRLMDILAEHPELITPAPRSA